jgi:hypothetical protein
VLFEPSRHEPLVATPWDEGAVRDAIAEIARDAEQRFAPQHFWPLHPLDNDVDPKHADGLADLYFGAAGVIWALHALERRGVARLERDYRPQLESVVQAAHARLRSWVPEHVPAYLLGDLGARVVQQSLDPSPARADALHDWLDKAPRAPTHEMMWGAPGVALALTFLLEASGDARWRALLAREVDAVLEPWRPCPHAPVDLWEQNVYGQRAYMLDSVHGSAGNAHALLRAAELLGDPRRAAIAGRAAHFVCALARLEDGTANWHVVVPPPPARPGQPEFLVHYCHGAPGFVVCLDGVRPGEHAELDRVLTAAAELVWRAGPLRKGANLCHGTAGNGYALLKLWRRSGEAHWLERARAFAMHALLQVRRAREQYGRGRYALWTGDVGSALYLASCLDGDARFPTVDVF